MSSGRRHVIIINNNGVSHQVLKIMEVDEDEVDDCKSNFYSDLKSVVIKSIRGRDVPKISTSPYKRRNKRSVVDGGIQDSSDLERRQA